jgi:transposase InsO family protein
MAASWSIFVRALRFQRSLDQVLTYRGINALAESFNGLYKNELIHRKGPWRNVEHVEWATLNYVDWFNNRRIHESLNYVTPVEFEARYYDPSESESLAVLGAI